MRLAVVTGGAATGKSTAVDLFRKHNVTVIDARTILRSVLRASASHAAAIATRFPAAIAKPGAPPSVKLLESVVYSDPNEKRALEDIVGPAMTKFTLIHILMAWLRRSRVVVLDSPLFFESSIPAALFHDVITVHADADVQRHRLTAVMGGTAEAADKRMKGQIPLEYKRAMSSIVLENNGEVDALEQQVDDVVRRWAGQRPPLWGYPDPLLVVGAAIALIGFFILYLV
jgi:dephospho-CoA kinase